MTYPLWDKQCFDDGKSNKAQLTWITLPNFIKIPPEHTHPSLRTYALTPVHREGDVVEDGASGLSVFGSEALDVHLAAVGPAVQSVGVVDDEIRAPFTTRLSREQLF